MKGDPRSSSSSNEALKNELTATNQYWLHYRLLDNWGVQKLAEFERSESIDEMKHADRLAERILFLEACPISRPSGACISARMSRRYSRADLELEIEALTQLKGAIAHCERSATTSAATSSPTSSRMRRACRHARNSSSR